MGKYLKQKKLCVNVVGFDQSKSIFLQGTRGAGSVTIDFLFVLKKRWYTQTRVYFLVIF
jgi:hypothetical protein